MRTPNRTPALTPPDFNTLSARLPPPFNLTFPLLQYWDGQPVTYVCKRRADTEQGKAQDEGTVYFAVAFEIVDEEAIEGLKGKGGSVQGGQEGEGGSVVAGSGEEGQGTDDVD